MLALWLVAVDAMRICDIGIPCQEIDPGVVRGEFNITPSKTRQIWLTSIVDCRNVDVLGHFVAHYTAAGLPTDHLLLVLNAETDDACLAGVRQRAAALGLRPLEWVGQFSATAALYHRLRLLERVSHRDWLFYADVDEFARLPVRLPEFVQRLEAANATVLYGALVDRVSRNGSLPKITPYPSLAEQFPNECHITWKLLRGSTRKIVLLRGDARASAGNHRILPSAWFLDNHLPVPAYPPESAYREEVKIDHYKWVDGITESLQKRLVYYRDVLRASWWSESAQFLQETANTSAIDVGKFCVASAENRKQPSRASLLSQQWKRVDVAMPACFTDADCLSLPANDARCVGREELDKGLAEAVLHLATSGSLWEVGAGAGCYSFFWARRALLNGFNATECSEPAVERSTAGLIRFVDATSAAIDADWLVVQKRAASRVQLEALGRHALYGIVLFDAEARQHALVSEGFALHTESTLALRSASQFLVNKRSATVYLRRRLIGLRLPTDFLLLNASRDDAQWNDRVVFDRRWYRVHVPLQLAWHSCRIVVGVLSVCKNAKTRTAMRETLLVRARSAGVLVFFVVAQPTPAAVHEAQLYHDMMLIDSVDMWRRYNSTLPLKLFGLLQVAVRHATRAQWFFKMDDDTLLFADRLAAVLDALAVDPERENVYVGHPYPTPPVRDRAWGAYIGHDLYPASFFPLFMSGGAGYALSVRAARCVALHAQRSDFLYFPAEDVAVVLALREDCYPYRLVDREKNFRPSKPRNFTTAIVTAHYMREAADVYEVWYQQMRV